MKFHLRFLSNQEMLVALRRAPVTIPRIVRRGMGAIVRQVARRAKEIVPVGPGRVLKTNSKTGKRGTVQRGALRRSIKARTDRQRGAGTVIGMVYSKWWYSRIREEGTGYLPGGAIRPRRHKFMRFMAGGKFISTRAVRQKGSFYLKRGLQDSFPFMLQQTTATAADIAAELKK